MVLVFTLGPLGDTWLALMTLSLKKNTQKRKEKKKKKRIFPNPQPLPQHDRDFAHRWTSVCNLRVDKDSTPGVCSVRKIKQKSKTAFIFQQLVLYVC